jgi:hypothetical protein
MCLVIVDEMDSPHFSVWLTATPSGGLVGVKSLLVRQFRRSLRDMERSKGLQTMYARTQ